MRHKIYFYPNRKHTMKKQSSLLAVAILSLFLAACGDKPAEPAAPAPTPASPAAEAPAAPAPSQTAPAAPEAAAPDAAPAAAAVATDSALGKSVYGKTCALCHGAGIAGAPKPGDKDDWGPRIAQGKETLYKHAIEGYTGAKGMMPPRGGGAKLSDDEVKAAVDFMADQSI